ncbi:hypothetical protein NPIL_627281 [Nephila pilipes]|uniref:Uncharacterized protein n=1 Tax=Nephila pilipes TaxID=299642 RepID=A0A8X6TBA2_NEPPI|nr:hypothetical protein NPIL_627281 [Nephila pilipes]
MVLRKPNKECSGKSRKLHPNILWRREWGKKKEKTIHGGIPLFRKAFVVDSEFHVLELSLQEVLSSVDVRRLLSTQRSGTRPGGQLIGDAIKVLPPLGDINSEGRLLKQ